MSTYDRDYFERITRGPQSGYDDPNKLLTLKRHLRRLERALSLRAGDRVLDIGCAYGLFLGLCDERGYDTYGIDVSEHAIDEAKKRTKAALALGDIDGGLPYPDATFHLVTLFDVIEHLPSPNSSLKEILRVIRPAGHLVLTTLNARAISKYIKKDCWNVDKDPTHLYVFDPLSLKFMLQRAGYEVEWVRTPFTYLSERLSAVLERTGLGGQVFCLATPADDRTSR